MKRARSAPAGEVTTSPAGAAPISADDFPARIGFLQLHPWLVDVTIAVVYATQLMFARAYNLVTGVPGETIWLLLLVPVSAACLVFRRHRPVTVLIAVAVIASVLSPPLGDTNDLVAVPIALYAVAVYRTPRVAWFGFLGFAFIELFGIGLWSSMPRADGQSYGDAISLIEISAVLPMLCVSAILTGMLVRGRREQLRILVDRARQMARERDSQAQIATLAERSRIAREMHDIVAHSLSVIVALADGATATAQSDPAATRNALDRLSDTGRTAMNDMRRLLGVLSGEEPLAPELHPTPGYTDLDSLVESFRAAGMPVRLSKTGMPTGSPAVQLTVYRIAQESLTNVLRYAVAPTRVEVAVVFTDSETILTVTNNGQRPAPRPESSGAGRGIIGMIERAAVHDGIVETGPWSGGGWRVRASIPRDPQEAR